MRIAILGFSGTVKEAPWGDPSWTMWGMNGLWRVLRDSPELQGIPEDRFAMWFELHTKEFLDLYGPAANIGRQQHEWLERKHPFPIMTQDPRPEWPSSKRFPIEDVIKKLGRDYFTSSVALEFAYAMTLPGVEEIGLWGIDLVHGTEWGDQRPCTEYWMGRAEAMGIKVTKHPRSALLTSSYRYAYEHPNELLAQLSRTLHIQLNTTNKKLEELRDQSAKVAAAMQTEDGARQGFEFVLERLEQYKRGGEA